MLEMNGLRCYQRLLRQCVCTLFVLVLQKCPVLPSILPKDPSSAEREQIIAFVKTHLLQTQVEQNGQAKCVHHMKFPNWFTSLK